MLEWIVSSILLILAVAALRAVSKGRISFRMRYALWLLVLLRLLIPVNFGAAEWSAGNLTRRAAETEGVKLAAGFAQTTLPRRTYGAAYTEVAEEYAEQGVDISTLPAEEFEAVDYEILARMDGEWTVRKILTAGWLLGAAAVGFVMLAANIRFAATLRKTRQKLEVPSSALPVYLSPAAETPCLFGLFRPAVYVTPEAVADSAALCHVVAHELTHFRHGDHIWSLLRGVCLALHWYNPAVWWAASLSQRDAELACDEATIERLGEGERAAYGYTLLKMTCEKRQNILRLATTMTGSKNVIKERIVSIAKKPKPAVIAVAAVLLLGALAVGCTFTGAAGEDEPLLPPDAGSEDIVPAETVPALSPEEEKAAAERLAAVQAAEKKLAGYRWPRETVQKTIGDREVEFVLYHGDGWTIDVPVGWTQIYSSIWSSPSGNTSFTVIKVDLPVNNPKSYRAQSGSWRHETYYAPPFDYYYDDDGGYTPPEGNADYIYFFAPAGEKSYELELMTIVGRTTDEERAMQEAMLLSFTQDESSHALRAAEYKPGASEWDAAIAGLVAESEKLWFSWPHSGSIMKVDGKGRPEYFSYAQALTEFRPEEFTQTFFGRRPEGAEILDREYITICLPELWIWLHFYDGSPWMHISCAWGDFWTQLHRPDAPEAFAFDAARAWLEMEYAWANG